MCQDSITFETPSDFTENLHIDASQHAGDETKVACVTSNT